MKKLAALLMLLALTLSMTVSALAAYDFSFVDASPSLYFVSRESDGTAFIYSAGRVEDLCFAHPYESKDYYSFMYNDVVVLDYDSDDAFAVWRLWIEYTGTKALKAKSVDFIFDGRTFTFDNLYDFTDVYSEEYLALRDDGVYAETGMLMFGSGSIYFIEALRAYINKLADSASPRDGVLRNGELTMVLHGADEDLTIQAPRMLLRDFDLIIDAFANGGGSLDDAPSPNPVTEK